jgi:hypothetical protein
MKIENIYNIGFYDIKYVPYDYALPVADPGLEHYFTLPKWLKKTHHNNKWRITFTNFNVIDPHGVGGGNNPVKTWCVDGLDNKSYFFGRGANAPGGSPPYNVIIPSSNALQVCVANDYKANVLTYADNYDAAICCIDQLPQNAMRFTFFMSGFNYGLNSGVGGSYYGQPVYIGFNMRIEELSNQMKLLDDLMFQPDVIQTYNQCFTANSNNRVSFKFDPMIRKRNPKNRWLATCLNVGMYDLNTDEYEPNTTNVEIDSLSVNGFGGGIYPQENYLTGQPFIWAQINTNTNNQTNNAVIISWLDENYNQLDVSTLFEAGEANTISNAKYVYVPSTVDLSLLKWGRLSIIGTDGVRFQKVNVNSIYSSNIGWVDNDNPNEPTYRDYDMTVSLLDNPLIAELQNYTLLGNRNVIASNNGGYEWFSYAFAPQKFIMNDLPQDFNVIAFSRVLALPFQESVVKYAPPTYIDLIPNEVLTNFCFTIRLEEII